MALTAFQKLLCNEIAQGKISDFRTFFEQYQERETKTTKVFVGRGADQKMFISRNDSLLLQSIHEFISLIRSLERLNLVYLENVEGKKMIQISVHTEDLKSRIYSLVQEFHKNEIVPSSELQDFVKNGFLPKEELKYEAERVARQRSEKRTRTVAYISITVTVLLAISTSIFNLVNYQIAADSLSLSQKVQAASLEILESHVITILTTRYFQYIVETKITNTSNMPAKKVKVMSRADLLQQDFVDNEINYSNSSTKAYPFISLNDIVLRDTIDFRVRASEVDKIGRTLWPYLHIRIEYNNGFDKRITTNLGFRFDMLTNERYECKHMSIRSK